MTLEPHQSRDQAVGVPATGVVKEKKNVKVVVAVAGVDVDECRRRMRELFQL